VVAVHTVHKTIPGGGSGVDMFFVLSGFLISGIILRALVRGEFTFSGFYARRIRRIFPALIVVLVTVWVVGSVVLLPVDGG
jgi:peptidoglycan/LPS O-acetylase OafA/YrhL